MIAGAALWPLLLAAPELESLLPCQVGLTVEYEALDARGAPTGRRHLEIVRGPGPEPRTCLVDLVSSDAGGKPTTEAFLREHLPDRISDAGWAATPSALRPPLLKAPIERGRHWQHNRTRFEIVDVAATFDLPGGATLRGCVRVTERSIPAGNHEAHRVYCPGAGLVSSQSAKGGRRAVRVTTTAPAPKRE